MNQSYAIWPLRFSAHPQAMIRFFSDLGLQKTFDHDSGTFATFAGRSGSIGVHDASATASGTVPVHTALNLATRDLGVAAEELASAGLSARVWDETYGKQGVVDSPAGLVIGLNEDRQEDLYGGYRAYEGSEQSVAASMDVIAVCNARDLEVEARFFSAFGFTADDPDAPAAGRYVNLRVGAAAGIIALHPAAEGEARLLRPDGDAFGPPYEVALAFETSEPLDALAGRLIAAGYQARTVDDEDGQHVEVVDPDGETIQIHLTS